MAQAVFPPEAVEAVARGEILLQRPEMKKMLDMDKAMADMLSRTDLQPAERFKEYMKIFQRFRTLRDDVLVNGSSKEVESNLTNTAQIDAALEEAELEGTSSLPAEQTIDITPETPPNAQSTNVYPNVTIIKDASTAQLKNMDTEPQTSLAEEFLKAVNESESIGQADGQYYIPNEESEAGDINLSGFINSILNFLLEGRPLSKETIEKFDDLKPLLKNAPRVYALVAAKMPRSARLAPPKRRRTRPAVPNKMKFQRGAGEIKKPERCLFNVWDTQLRSTGLL